MFDKIVNRLSLHQRGAFIANVSWLALSEAAAKVSRLATIFALAAVFAPAEYGMVMLALAFHDIVRVLMRCGSGPQIVRCTDGELATNLRHGSVLQWCVCLGLVCLQVAMAYASLWIYASQAVFTILLLTAPVFAVYPLVSLRVFMIVRSNNMKTISLVSGTCVLVENLSTALLAIMGLDIYAVIAGKYLFMLCWIGLLIRYPAPVLEGQVTLKGLTELAGVSAKLVTTELLKTLRQHADLLIAGRLLAPEAFGLYSFAKSAGWGISQSLCNAFNNALYPHLCQVHRDGDNPRHIRRLCLMVAAISGLFLVQAASTFVYIPLLFSDTWATTTSTSAMLCVAIVFVFLLDCFCAWVRSVGDYSSEMMIRAVTLALFLACIASVLPDTPFVFACTVALAGAASLAAVALVRYLRGSLQIRSVSQSGER